MFKYTEMQTALHKTLFSNENQSDKCASHVQISVTNESAK